jgi:hypothetical protein
MLLKQVVGKVIVKNRSPMTPAAAEKGSAIPVRNVGLLHLGARYSHLRNKEPFFT